MASSWLKSVNNLLDSLDDQAENVVDVVSDVVNDPTLPTSKGAVGRVLSRRGMDYDDSEEDFSDDDDEYEEDEAEDDITDEVDNEDDDEEEVNLEADQSEEKSEPLFQDFTVKAEESPDESFVALTPPKQDSPILVEKPVVQSPPQSSSSGVLVPPQQPPPTKNEAKEQIMVQAASPQQEGSTKPSVEEQKPQNPIASPKENVNQVEQENSPAGVHTPAQTKTTKESIESGPKSPPSATLATAPPSSGSVIVTGDVSKLQQQVKKYKQEIRKAQTEARQLRKHVMKLTTDLDASESEVKAQRGELERAAERIEKERQRMDEDREELMDEHDEELENQKEQYEKMLKEQKERLEEQIEELQDRLADEEDQRRQEGGDWNKELDDAVKRERETLKRLSSVKEENATMKNSMAKLETQHSALQARVESLTQTSQNASDRERKVEDKLDAALSAHSRQLSQRQAREGELERTIADLGAALAKSRQKEKSTASLSPTKSVGAEFKGKYENVLEELELLRSQLVTESDRSEALRQELSDINRERSVEAAEARGVQLRHDNEISKLRQNISKLEGSLRDRRQPIEINETDTEKLVRELEEAKSQTKSLSADLLRHQTKTDSSKTEILALKNRLQAATQRAETAENSLSSGRNVYEMEGGGMAYGGATMRRRVKGGRGKQKSNQNVRSIRSALNLGPGQVNEGPLEQVAVTIDALDAWLVDTGAFMKQEPLARLGLMMYFFILHFWSFCLVMFHASSYEEVHGDFGSMGDPTAALQNPASPLMKEHQP